MSATPAFDSLPFFGNEDEMLYRVSTQLAFDSLVKSVVRGHYGFDPMYVTLQIEGADVMLYVEEAQRSHIVDDPALLDWVLDFIAGDVFSIDPANVEMIYLDGPVASTDDPYLLISGRGLLIVSGKPITQRKNRH